MFVATLLLFGIVFSQMAGECSGDASAQLEQEEAAFRELVANFPKLKQAETYRRNGDHGRAKATYNAVVTDHPGTDYALEAQSKLVTLYKHDQQQARAAFRELIVNFSNHQLLVEIIYDIAEHYHKTESYQKYEMAKQFYQYILDSWPEHERAMWAQSGVAVSNICLGEMEAAKAAAEKLIVDFSDNEGIAKVVYDIAHQFNRFEEYKKAGWLYGQVIASWPESKHAMWKQLDLIHAKLSLGNDTAVQPAIDELVANLSNHEFIATALFDIAEHYGRLGKHQKAAQLYQYIADNWRREDIRSMWSQMRVAMSYISLDNETAAQIAIDKLVANFSKNERIADAVYAVADHYNKLEKYEKARQVYQHVLENWPKHEHHRIWTQVDLARTNIILGDTNTAKTILDSLVAKLNAGSPGYSYWPAVAGEAYYHVGGWYGRMGKFDEAVGCYQKIVDDYPGHRRAEHTQYLIGLQYELMKGKGLISESEADTKIKAAYEKLLEKYPTCPEAEYVQRWIVSYNSQGKGESK